MGRKGKGSRTRTVHQTGLGKRMEFTIGRETIGCVFPCMRTVDGISFGIMQEGGGW